MLYDGFQRKIEYLRLSVTDLCNIRCQYCMPLEGAVKKDRPDILSFEEIYRLVSGFVRLGVKSVRITGGEPLVRQDLPKLVAMLKTIPDLEDLLLTTNGILLKDLAGALKDAGLSRINIHLDTLDAKKFSQMTHWGKIEDVFAGIREAQAVGLTPIKINAVLLKDYNDSEIESLSRFAAEQNLTLRFIELMPIGPGKAMKERFLPTNFVLEQLQKKYTVLPFGKRLGRGPAEYFKIIELNSVIGLIHPVSKPFCEQCNRIRLSADGRFQDCLAYDESYSLRDLLRTPQVSDDAIEEKIKQMITFKRSDHGGFMLPQCMATAGMYGIGG